MKNTKKTIKGVCTAASRFFIEANLIDDDDIKYRVTNDLVAYLGNYLGSEFDIFENSRIYGVKIGKMPIYVIINDMLPGGKKNAIIPMYDISTKYTLVLTDINLEEKNNVVIDKLRLYFQMADIILTSIHLEMSRPAIATALFECAIWMNRQDLIYKGFEQEIKKSWMMEYETFQHFTDRLKYIPGIDPEETEKWGMEPMSKKDLIIDLIEDVSQNLGSYSPTNGQLSGCMARLIMRALDSDEDEE